MSRVVVVGVNASKVAVGVLLATAPLSMIAARMDKYEMSGHAGHGRRRNQQHATSHQPPDVEGKGNGRRSRVPLIGISLKKVRS